MAPDRLGCLASISPHSGCRTGTTSGVHLMRPLHLRLRATCHLPKLQINILIFIICGVANQSRSHRFSLSHCASFTPCLIRINGTHTRCFCISCGKLGMWWHPPPFVTKCASLCAVTVAPQFTHCNTGAPACELLPCRRGRRPALSSSTQSCGMIPGCLRYSCIDLTLWDCSLRF